MHTLGDAKMSKCKKCIIPDSFPNITFKNGICSFCVDNQQVNRITKSPKELLRILKAKENHRYDCLVPVSGGKDSSYVLFYVVRKFGLKPLALYVDSSFLTKFSRKNVQKICRRLSVDLIIIKATNFRKKAVREALCIYRITKQDFGICGNCENNLRTAVINEANKRNIPFILWGSTDLEDTVDKYIPEWQLGQFREKFGETRFNISQIFKRFRRTIFSFLRTRYGPSLLIHTLKYYCYIILDNVSSNSPEGWRKLNPFLGVSFKNKRVKTIYFFDYIPYNPFKFVEILKKEMLWEDPSGKGMRLDCKLHRIRNYDYLERTGITQDGFILANLVRNGLLKRPDAIQKEEAIQEKLELDCKNILS